MLICDILVYSKVFNSVGLREFQSVCVDNVYGRSQAQNYCVYVSGSRGPQCIMYEKWKVNMRDDINFQPTFETGQIPQRKPRIFSLIIFSVTDKG